MVRQAVNNYGNRSTTELNIDLMFNTRQKNCIIQFISCILQVITSYFLILSIPKIYIKKTVAY